MKRIFIFVIAIVLLIFALLSCEKEMAETTQSITSSESLTHEHTIVVDEAVPATCIQTGLTQGAHCSECGEVIVSQKITNLAPHTNEIMPSIESTCTENGLTGGVKCSVCGEILIEQQQAPLKSHTYDDADDAVCNICNYERYCLHTNTRILNEVAPTCTQTGLSEGVECVDCKEILVAQQVIAIIPHTESDWIIDKEATSDDEGQKHIECIICHLLLKSEIIDKLPLSASEGLEFVLNGDGTSYSVLGIGNCVDTFVIIPDTYNGLPVTRIEDKAFYYCKFLESILIPDSVISIGNKAFESCILLTSIEIPDSVKTLGNNAFYDCRMLVSATIGNSVTKIDYETFSNCSSLESVIIGNSVTSIGYSAFYGCISLKSISIPDSVITMEHSVFRNCSSLANVTLGNSLSIISEGVFQNCSSLVNIVIPSSVTTIDVYAFRNCSSLKTLIIPENVIVIGEYAFEYCDSLTIYCEASEKPSGWHNNWNKYGGEVVWNYKN